MAQAREHVAKLRRVDPKERNRHSMEHVPVHELRVLECRTRTISFRDVNDCNRHESTARVLGVEMHREFRIELDALRGTQHGLAQE
ncbi:MAG TPA: hypothetical protein VJ484_02945, partial [Lysobacter sp.]|nr:hypothetical protein [Lysobacter sp.]